MTLVLYRKYRPQTFSEIVGQEHVVKTLTNAISNGMVSHAYLFSGPRGSGKTTIARLLAKAVNCENRKSGELAETSSHLAPRSALPSSAFEPCNKCNSCLEIMEGRSLDLIEIDAASHRGIDEIRELRDGIQFIPTKSKYKVFIIDESHQLTKEASNALLKTLEEPPGHAIFVLATTEIHKMIPTIISRCQRFDFRKLTIPEIIKRLEFVCQKERAKVAEALPHLPPHLKGGSVIEKAALELIAINAGGSIRDGESILDQALTFSGNLNRELKADDVKEILGLVDTELVSNFTGFLYQKKTVEAINLLNEVTERGLDLQEFSKSLINYLRQVLILHITGASVTEKDNPIITGLTKEEFEKLKIQATAFKEEELRRIIELFLEAENKMRYSPILQLPLELAIIEAVGPKE